MEFDVRILGISIIIWGVFATIFWLAPYRETFGFLMTILMILILLPISYIVVWIMDNK